MEIEVKQGNLTIIRSGSVLVYNDVTTLILEGNYIINFKYEDGAADDPQKFDIKPNDNGIDIVLQNFNNPIGSATAKPIPIAKQGDKIIYIAFAVYRIGTAKMLHYNISVGGDYGETKN